MVSIEHCHTVMETILRVPPSPQCELVDCSTQSAFQQLEDVAPTPPGVCHHRVCGSTAHGSVRVRAFRVPGTKAGRGNQRVLGVLPPQPRGSLIAATRPKSIAPVQLPSAHRLHTLSGVLSPPAMRALCFPPLGSSHTYTKCVIIPLYPKCIQLQ